MSSVSEDRENQARTVAGQDRQQGEVQAWAPPAGETPAAIRVRSRPRGGVQSCPAEIASRLAIGRPLVRPQGNGARRYRFVKRAIDVFGAAALLLLLGPLLLLTFLALLFTTRGRPLSAQRRVGHCGRAFTLVTFRTMSLMENHRQGPVFKNRHAPRVTRLGRVLRRWGLAETPQLFSVLAGQMSLVGPRAPTPEEVVRYETWQLLRLSVKPGLTCLWRTCDRSEIGFDECVRMDLWYLRNQNLGADLRLLAHTRWAQA